MRRGRGRRRRRSAAPGFPPGCYPQIRHGEVGLHMPRKAIRGSFRGDAADEAALVPTECSLCPQDGGRGRRRRGLASRGAPRASPARATRSRSPPPRPLRRRSSTSCASSCPSASPCSSGTRP
ncbi:uncharacterized protein SOCEGT47_036780 [Sorangium cellulosum]|uniref:Uncharacterized protein n=1 Tax=Sorangium cellulosum TaxID=56 RepID=A0A4P2Q1Q3_SORCE|nr:uncharacterized protein SOCEGT47_036780 [Sorangium cellulosum]